MIESYRDDETQTLGDFLKWTWVYVIPLINIFFSIVILIMYIGELKIVKRIRVKWNQFLNTPIKK